MGTCLDFQRCDCKPINYKLLSPGTSVKRASCTQVKWLIWPPQQVLCMAVVMISICHAAPASVCLRHPPPPAPTPTAKQGLPSCLLLEQPQAASLPSQGRRESWEKKAPNVCPLVGEMRNDDPRSTVTDWSLEVEPHLPPLLVQPRLSCSLPPAAALSFRPAFKPLSTSSRSSDPPS